MARPLNEQTLEFLELLLWVGDDFFPPSMRKADRSFEPYRAGDVPPSRRLPPNLLQAEQRAGKWVMQLTVHGRLLAAGGRDPVTQWGRPWDGQWRMVMFDLPVKQQKLRQQLLRWFRQNGFGYLQNSVWITPDRLTELTAALDEFRDDVESLTVVESRCHAGYSDAALVSGAWDFEEINGRYATHLSQANGELQRRLPAAGGVAELRTRMRQERIAWTTAVGIDPLLPQALLPDGYRGRQAWEAHVSVMTRLSRGLAAELRRQ